MTKATRDSVAPSVFKDAFRRLRRGPYERRVVHAKGLPNIPFHVFTKPAVV